MGNLNNKFNNPTAQNKGARKLFRDLNIYYMEDMTTGKITIEGDLDLRNKGLDKLPDLSNVIVQGDFDCSDNNLTSLEGSPKTVTGSFNCECNELTSLEGATENIGNCFTCDHNQLTSLLGAPKNVVGYFSCNGNQLVSLIGAPENVFGNFYCSYNHLTSVIGISRVIGGSFNGRNNATILEYEEPFDQYWIDPAQVKSVKKEESKKVITETRNKKIGDFRRFALSRRKK